MEIQTSNCCNADMPDYPDNDRCPKCFEHCSPSTEDMLGSKYSQ